MIRVLGDRVLVALRPTPAERVSDGGIVLVKDPDAIHTPTQGIVMALGKKTGAVAVDDVAALLERECVEARSVSDVIAAIKTLAAAPFDVEPGDCVLFSRGAGDLVTDDGVDYVILLETDIIGIVPELAKEEEAA